MYEYVIRVERQGDYICACIFIDVSEASLYGSLRKARVVIF